MNVSAASAQASPTADCPDGPFETDIDKISRTPAQKAPPVRSQQAANFVVPIEITRILEGAVSFFQGGSMNEGMSTWYAFDVERRMFIAVLANTGEHPKRVPAPEKLSANQLLRYTDATGNRRAEFVTVVEATPAQVREFACLANKLLASESDATPRPAPADTIARAFALLHKGKPAELGKGAKQWEVEGELARFISQPLQEPILRSY
jgi:hypothetical protein